MPVYELSIEAAHVREGERVVSLEGRGFPTVMVRWDSRIFDQPWQTTVVLDYAIALPPLMVGQASFHEVKIAAFVGGASTKFMYFGTEMSGSVPRVAPEMENAMSPGGLYQEFRLEEQTCPLPYLRLIQATPRIYGPGPQDYYSPPLKVERFDGVAGSEQVADFFPTIVANLETVKGGWLTDSSKGLWNGARYVGATKIAILRQGKVVGLHERLGRTDKDAVPPELKRRDPKLDVMKSIVSVDIGASSIVVARRGERSPAELLRIGPTGPVTVPADFETPAEVSFANVGRTIKAWRDRVILPMTKWDDVHVGFAAKKDRTAPGAELPARAMSSIAALTLLRDRAERGEQVRLVGREDLDAQEMLKRPAPPVIDEDGIGAHDPFDLLELFAYYVGLTLNHRTRGLHLRWRVSMPTGWSAERRSSALVAFRRGVFRSLPAGLVDFHDLERFEVLDAGVAALCFTAQALRTFNIQPKLEAVPLATIDCGASETGMLFAVFRSAKPDERTAGYERMIEYVEPRSIPWLGGERILHRLAYRVFLASQAAFHAGGVAIERPQEETTLPSFDDLLRPGPIARANTTTLKDALRPVLEGTPGKLPTSLKLLSHEGSLVDVAVDVDREGLVQAIGQWFDEGASIFKEELGAALQRIGKEPDPYEGLRVLVGGRVGMSSRFVEAITAALPSNVTVHRFKEPDKSNLAAPTVKTSTALGALVLSFDRVGAVPRSEKRTAFRYRVGRARHGQLADALDPTVEYDTWREMGACSKPDVELLFMVAEDMGDVAADDPRVKRAVCTLGPKAVGARLYVRATGPSRAELSFGAPGGEPDKTATRFVIDLGTGTATASA